MQTYCVLVAYNPNIELLIDVVASLHRNKIDVIIVDNSSSCDVELKFSNCDGVSIISLGSNHGIGYAQNVGVNLAICNGADYILLSDHDTVYPSGCVPEMIASYERLAMTQKVAAVCPNFFDTNRSELCPMIVDAGPLGFKIKTATSGVHKVCFANASGMLIPAKVFVEVGLMREDLFIDCVDTEWCTRAEHLGYSIYCNADMVITHSLGDRSINVLGRVITQHSPLRHYYLARNSMYLALYSRPLALNKRLFFLLRALKRVVGHAVLSAPRLENLSKGLLGLWHGVIGRLGKYE